MSDQTEDILKLIRKIHPNIHYISVDEEIIHGRQSLCYRKLFELGKEVSNSAYCLFVDIEEFWVAKPFPKTINIFLEANPTFDCFSFQWVNCFNEDAFAYPLQDSAKKGNSHVKSMIGYSSEPVELRPHAPILKSKKIISSIIGDTINQNFSIKDDKIFINQKTINPSTASLGNKHQALIFHRIQRSELEYTHRLFKPHANADPTVSKFKTNRNGFRTPPIKRDLTEFYKSFLPKIEILRYHKSLQEFINTCGTKELVHQAQMSMSENVILGKILKIPRESLIRDKNTIERIFSGTRFIDYILKKTSRDL